MKFEPRRNKTLVIIGPIVLLALIVFTLWLYLFHSENIIYILLPLILIIALGLSLFTAWRVKGYELREDRIVVVGPGTEMLYSEITEVRRGSLIDVSLSRWKENKLSFSYMRPHPTASDPLTDDIVHVHLGRKFPRLTYGLTPVKTEEFIKELKKRIPPA